MTDTLTLCKGPVSLVHRSRSLSLYDPQDFSGGSAFWLGRNVTSDLQKMDWLMVFWEYWIAWNPISLAIVVAG
jgi:hypothetical protein